MSIDIIKKAEEIRENYKLSKSGVSQFQLYNFVIGKEITVQGKQWQCIREINSRLESVKSMNLQMEEMEDNLALIDIKIKKAEITHNKLLNGVEGIETDELNIIKEELNIKKKKYNRQRDSIIASKLEVEALLNGIIEELNYLTQAFRHLLERKEWKEFDDMQAQADYWNSKLAYEVGMRMSLGRPIDMELGRTIDALPKNFPIKTEFLRLLNNKEPNGDK